MLNFTITSCQCQSEEEKIEKETIQALKKWFENPSVANDVLNPKIIEQFEDSGRFDNGRKEGLWIEYSVDALRHTSIFIVGDKQMPTTLGPTIYKEKGRYFNGKREGTWTKYVLKDEKTPFTWSRTSVINYRDGTCLVYKSDEAEDMQCVDLGVHRHTKPKTQINTI